MSRTHEVAWAAGFFDGEGYILIQKRGHTEYTGYYLRMGINHVCPDPLEEMVRLFGGAIRKDSTKPKGNRKQRYVWTSSTSNAASILRQMMPYLRNKNKEAQVALDFSSTIQPNKKKIPEEIQEYREWCSNELKRLNALD